MHKVIRDKLRCANCVSDKSRFAKKKNNKKVGGKILTLNYLFTKYYKTC